MFEHERPAPPRYEPKLSPRDTSHFSTYELKRLDERGHETTLRIIGVDPTARLDTVYPLQEDADTANRSLILTSGCTASLARDALNRQTDPAVVLHQHGLECYYAYMHMRNGGQVESWDMPESEQFEVLENLAQVLAASQTHYAQEQISDILNSELDAMRHEYAGSKIAVLAESTPRVLVTCQREETEMLKNAVVASLAGFVDVVREVYEVEEFKLRDND